MPSTWPIAFSTLGCPGEPIRDVLTLARRTDWHGVELRVHAEEPVSVDLGREQRAAYRARFDEAGIVPLAVDSYARVASAEVSDDDCVADVLHHVELATDLGASFVRVFPGGDDSPDADERAVRRLRAIADRLPAGVTVVLETHDSHRAGADAARVLRQVDRPGIGGVWDVMHTWLAGEAPAETARTLAPWLGYVQIKDVRRRDDLTPCFLGDGVVPLTEIVESLRVQEYDGWLSLEWERRWHPAAAPLPEALVRARAWLAREGIAGTEGT